MIITDATNLPRLLICNGSRLMSADPAFAERDNTIRNEGNAAHWLASVVFNKLHTLEELADRKAPNGVYVTSEMIEHVHDYLSCIDRAPDQWCAMEWSYQITGPNWQVNGRTDHVARTLDILSIDDFKYGYSVVEPENNWTLISHAIGYCITNDFKPSKVVFTIHQPRAPHYAGRVRHVEMTYDELLARYHYLNATLSNPSNFLQTSEHCYKCPSFASCPARQNAELNAIETSHIAFNAHISNEDLAERMDQISRAMELLKQSAKVYEEQTITRVKAGQIVANYGLKNELTNRMWVDGINPEMLAALTNRDISKRSMPNLKDAEDAFGVEFVNGLTERRNKGTKLVRINANKRGEQLFGKK